MIIITDMKNLPHSCHDCRVNCGRFFKENGEYKRHPDCPLKEVSECEDCISRAEVLKIFDEWFATCDIADKKDSPKLKIKALSSVTPQEPTDKIFTKADIDAIVKAINKGWELRVNEVLNKIREEVESIEHYGTNDGNDFWLRTPDEIKKDVLAILDKYKEESEKT